MPMRCGRSARRASEQRPQGQELAARRHRRPRHGDHRRPGEVQGQPDQERRGDLAVGRAMAQDQGRQVQIRAADRAQWNGAVHSATGRSRAAAPSSPEDGNRFCASAASASVLARSSSPTMSISTWRVEMPWRDRPERRRQELAVQPDRRPHHGRRWFIVLDGGRSAIWRRTGGRGWASGAHFRSRSRSRICRSMRTSWSRRPMARACAARRLRAGPWRCCSGPAWRPRPNKLAGGLPLIDRKRLEFAKAMASKPRLILLDEIAAGLTEPRSSASSHLSTRSRPITPSSGSSTFRTRCARCRPHHGAHFGRKVLDGPPAEVMYERGGARNLYGAEGRWRA